MLAIRLFEHKEYEKVYNLVGYCANYFREKRVDLWIAECNGWVSAE